MFMHELIMMMVNVENLMFGSNDEHKCLAFDHDYVVYQVDNVLRAQCNISRAIDIKQPRTQ